ncbi:amino-acid N-acetyltransferase [Desulfogranum japonicum]|uniref:amino-acid N-acetyltransferase n=1 Tax=Desulfogranum japonicum TaxID=231447 RepID=UPI0004141A43|nr:amino-acid N-acetyltransferase [Desulfogranum japonicum]
MNITKDPFLEWFRNVSPYFHDHRGKTIVIMIPGDCLSQGMFSGIVSDLAILHALGVRLVLVHGARLQIDEELHQKGFVSKFHKGVRITEREHISSIMKAVGSVRWQIEALFSSGLPNSPMYGAKIKIRSGNFITAMPKGIIDGIDHQMTGKVRSVDGGAINDILKENGIVLLSPLGYSITGEVFNLSFADIGICVASTIKADKAIIFNDDGAIYDRDNKLYRELTLAQCKEFLDGSDLHAPSNSYFSLRACYSVCQRGVPRAHIISSRDDGSLLKELYTRDGDGTMVYSDSYEVVRQAQLEDVSGIINLISPLEQKGVLVKRSREKLENEIDYFAILEKDSLVIGCAALYPIEKSNAGELACVAIRKEYQKAGLAPILLAYVEKLAASRNITEIYTLTTRTAHWFLGQGFVEVEVDALPASRKALYNYQRNSKVFCKKL